MSAVKGWLVGLRFLQIAALLAGAAFAAILLAAFGATLDVVQHGEYAYSSYSSAVEPLAAAGVAVAVVVLAANLIAAGLCIAWLVYTLAPARRAQASCCGKRDYSFITYRRDVQSDTTFAVLYGINLISSVIRMRSSDVTTIAISAAMMVLFVATAVLSKNMGKAAKEQQAMHAIGTPCAGPAFAVAPAAAPSGLAAPPKVVEVV